MIKFSSDDNLQMQQQWVAELGIDNGIHVFIVGDTYDGAGKLESNGNLEKEIVRAYNLQAFVVGWVHDKLFLDTQQLGDMLVQQ